jgi:hypothetical protein
MGLLLLGVAAMPTGRKDEVAGEMIQRQFASADPLPLPVEARHDEAIADVEIELTS